MERESSYPSKEKFMIKIIKDHQDDSIGLIMIRYYEFLIETELGSDKPHGYQNGFDSF